VLPPAVQDEVENAFRELSQQRFAAALPSFRDAMAAYNDRPRREQETCSNIFDALESVAKAVFEMPNATFADVVKKMRQRKEASDQTLNVLEKMWVMANEHYRHGMTKPFTLKPAEVDFVLVSCIGAILLFVRL
jgi:hypothetical protein